MSIPTASQHAARIKAHISEQTELIISEAIEALGESLLAEIRVELSIDMDDRAIEPAAAQLRQAGWKVEVSRGAQHDPDLALILTIPGS